MFFVISFVVVFFIQSCDPCDGGKLYYGVSDVMPFAERITGIVNQDCCLVYKSEPIMQDTVLLRYDSLLIRIEPRLSFAMKQEKDSFFTGVGFPTVQACSPAVSYDYIFEFTVTSDKDYMDIFPAGADLTPVLLVSNGKQVAGSSIPEGLINHAMNDMVFLRFTQPPSDTSIRTLFFKFTFTDGRILTAKLEKLKLTN